MKGFVIITVYVICFISNSSGLRCYECDDVNPQYSINCSSDEVVEICDDSFTFCVPVSSKNDGSQYSHCGEKEDCIQKGCYGAHFCKGVRTFEIYFHRNLTVTCCKVDLCNTFSTA